VWNCEAEVVNVTTTHPRSPCFDLQAAAPEVAEFPPDHAQLPGLPLRERLQIHASSVAAGAGV
jgi:hypothetical protein